MIDYPSLEAFRKEVRQFYRRNSLFVDFPPQILRSLPHTADAKPEHGRVDLRHLNVVTIDPDTARDFDDGLSVEDAEDGRVVIGVHIADVSHWMAEDTPLDREARKRGNSNYFPWGFVPMLPERLTCDICSLRPDQDRLAVSCLFTVLGTAIENVRFTTSVIRSKKRLTYKQAQAILDGEPQKENWLFESLRVLHQVGLALRNERERRGGLNFELPEHEVEMDDNGRPRALRLREYLESNRLVEDWMLAANEAVAAFLSQRGASILYRNHEHPHPEDVDDFHDLCRALNLTHSGKDMPSRFRSVIRGLRDHPAGTILHRMLLRTVPKARYEPRNKGHFGIGARIYAHFTSPIRRYPDVVVHRALKRVLAGGAAKRFKKTRRRDLDLQKLGFHCSEREKLSMKLEREAYKWLACEFMADKVRNRYTGFVAHIADFGIFVQLKEIPVEGMIPRDDLPWSLQFNQRTLSLDGRQGKPVLQIGQEVDVIVTRVDPLRRQLDLRLASDERPGLREGGKPSAGKESSRPNENPRSFQKKRGKARKGR